MCHACRCFQALASSACRACDCCLQVFSFKRLQGFAKAFFDILQGLLLLMRMLRNRAAPGTP